MFNIRKLLLCTILTGAITLTGCTAPSATSSASQPQAETSVPDLSQPAEPDVSASQPDVPPTVPEPEPPAPEATPEPCQHAKTSTVTVQAANCTAQGHTNAVCAACSTVLASGTIPPLGHDYTQTTVMEATCETDGSRTTTCSRCGHVQAEPIPASGHNWTAATCGTTATCKICSTVSPTVTDHSWVVKYAMGKPECEHCGTKYPFDKLVIKSNMLDVPILAGTKSITIIDMSYEVRAFEGPFTEQSSCRLDITIEGIASNACTMTRGSHLIAADGTKINSIYDVHGATHPVCDGTFTELFSFDLPAAAGTYTFVFSAQ